MTNVLDFLAYPPEHVRLAICEWLRHHGIDPHIVPVPGRIERLPERRQIEHEAYVLGEDGHLVLDPHVDDAAREVRVVQLEAEPSPFPDVVLDRAVGAYVDVS
jgi:hypothetical protein